MNDYRYRGTDPDHPDNRSLREAMRRRSPLVYFQGIVPGRYLAVWPVYIVGDDPERLTVTVAVDDAEVVPAHPGFPPGAAAEAIDTAGDAYDERDSFRRNYITRSIRTRLHQRAFRERVLHAYRRQCAFCRLRHEELLDAAHIIPDTELAGEPLVRDGPTLVHAIQALHGQPIILPRVPNHRPDKDLLEVRYRQFQEAS